MNKITNIKVTVDNIAEGSFKFNHSVDLYKVENILADPKNKNKDIYKEKLKPFSYKDYKKVQIGSAGCQEFYNESSLNNSKGFINENAGAFFPENIHYPLSGDLKGIESTAVRDLTDAMNKNLTTDEFIKKLNLYKNSKVSNVNYEEVSAGEVVYKNPPFYNGYVTSRNHKENYARFNIGKKGWIFDDINISYENENEHNLPNLFNCESFSKMTKKEKISRIGSISSDTISFRESPLVYNQNRDTVFISGPFQFNNLKEINYLTFSLYAKSNLSTEIKGMYIVPETAAMASFRKTHGNSSFGNAYKISEDFFQSSFPDSLNLNNTGNLKSNYLTVNSSWTRFFKIFKYTKKDLENKKFYAVIIWPYRDRLEEIKYLNNPSADIKGSNRSSKSHTDKKEISFAGINIELNSSPSGFDSRYMQYRSGYEAPLKEHPLLFNLNLSKFTKSNPKNWVISYKRKFESKGLTEEDTFLDCISLYSGVYKWGYKKDKVFASTSSNIDNISALDYYNHWEEIFIYPKDDVNLWLEVKGINNQGYKIVLIPEGSTGISKYKGIPFNFILGSEMIRNSQGDTTLKLKNGSYRDLYITSLDNLQNLKEECIRIFNITDNNKLTTVFQTDFLEED